MTLPQCPFLSVCTPAYRESLNLPVFYEALKQVGEEQGWTWEWIIADDHSPDNTFEVIQELARKDPRVRGIRFSTNCGAHLAMLAALEHSSGQCIALLASDMQDHPNFIPTLVEEYKKGTAIVWAYRGKRYGEKLTNIIFSRVYYFFIRRFEGLTHMPPTGCDFLVLDRKVADALKRHSERNVSLYLTIMRLGFTQKFILYDKLARMYGETGWSFGKKVKIIADSFIPFSRFPAHGMTWIGVFTLAAGALLAFYCAAECVLGTCTNRPLIPAILLLLGGAQMIMLGITASVVWRVLDEVLKRPRYVVEADTAPSA